MIKKERVHSTVGFGGLIFGKRGGLGILADKVRPAENEKKQTRPARFDRFRLY